MTAKTPNNDENLKSTVAEIGEAQIAMNRLEELGVLSGDQANDYISDFLFSKGLSYIEYVELI